MVGLEIEVIHGLDILLLERLLPLLCILWVVIDLSIIHQIPSRMRDRTDRLILTK